MKNRIIDWILKSDQRYFIAIYIIHYFYMVIIWLCVPLSVVIYLPFEVAKCVISTVKDSVHYAAHWTENRKRRLLAAKQALKDD